MAYFRNVLLIVQIETIPRKLNGRKLKPSLNMSQEISGPGSLRTAGIFGTFVRRTYSCSEKDSFVHLNKNHILFGKVMS